MKKQVIYLVIISIIIFVILLIKNNQEKQYWLNNTPIFIELENRISGEVLTLSSPTDIEQILNELKNIKYTSKEVEETWGLGYSITIEYEDLIVNYYFATSTHLFITLNDESWREYVIEPNENSIYDQLRERFN